MLAYMDRCEEILFERPRDGLEVAAIAPELAAKVELQRFSRNELLVRAYAILGNAQRACGALREAARTHDLALDRLRKTQGRS